MYLIKAIKYIMLFFAVGWLSHSIWQEIMLVDQQVEASYPTMNQDFGKLISYLLGKIFRTVLYIILIIPSMIYGAFPLPRSLGTILFIEVFCFGVWVGLARPDVFQIYQERFLLFLRKQYAYWKPRVEKIYRYLQSKLSQNKLFQAFLEKIKLLMKMKKDKGKKRKT